MSDPWSETVAVAGSEKGVALTDNVAAFSELAFAPHVAGLRAPSRTRRSSKPTARGRGTRVRYSTCLRPDRQPSTADPMQRPSTGTCGDTGLRGKVVLVDFWTYTCINWLRQLPYVRAWAGKYSGQGLVVVGVHTPEFAFEKDPDNVSRAVREMRIDYPVAIDNDYAVWSAFDNHYWPAIYFADVGGLIRHHHFGEG